MPHHPAAITQAAVMLRPTPQQRVHLLHHLKRIRHVQHIRLPPRPPAIGIQVYRPPLCDESPADHVRLLAMTASRESFRVSGCGWSRGKADVLYVADAFEVMEKVNALLGARS